MFDKSSSFDRLFPNQDFLSGKGFGNLIALPLFKPTFEKGNSCFVNPESFEQITDQWDFLKNVQKVCTDYLDELYNTLSPDVQRVTFILRGLGKKFVQSKEEKSGISHTP
jgi:hypothetical protein